LDLLRALVVVGLVFFHSALIFDPHDDYYVKSTITTEAVTVLAALAVLWAMPLLFLIAGMGVLHSLRRRDTGRLVTERLRRLFVPLVFGSVTLNALPVWFRLRADPGYDEPYWRFHVRYLDVRLDLADFPFVVEGAQPDASFETGHLWFILLLLVFSVSKRLSRAQTHEAQRTPSRTRASELQPVEQLQPLRHPRDGPRFIAWRGSLTDLQHQSRYVGPGKHQGQPQLYRSTANYRHSVRR
jgi:hypothetical protein